MPMISAQAASEILGASASRSRALLAEYARALRAGGAAGVAHGAGEHVCEACGFANPERIVDREGFLAWYREVYGYAETGS